MAVLVCVAVHYSVVLGKSAAGPCKCDVTFTHVSVEGLPDGAP